MKFLLIKFKHSKSQAALSTNKSAHNFGFIFTESIFTGRQTTHEQIQTHTAFMGGNNTPPCLIPADMQYFASVTLTLTG